MITVENNGHSTSVERSSHYRECERKFIPVFPAQLDHYRNQARPIEQFYLSHPTEPFSLRFREHLQTDGTLGYEATLKDTGQLTPAGIDRLEVTTPVSAEQYSYFLDPAVPVIRKLRAEPLPGVIIDFYDDGSIQVESEDPAQWTRFITNEGAHFVETTSDRQASNEWRAHLTFRRTHNGEEALVPLADLQVSDILHDIITRKQTDAALTVHIGGRSGSGKTTLVKELQERLAQVGLTSDAMSTDHYHRGVTALTQINRGEPWTHWDDPVVYDTQAMAVDLANLQAGRAIYRRTIDWTTVEPAYQGVIQPVDVIIIEGIYARSADITHDDELCYEMTTPFATCVGRRIVRDMRERAEFADPMRGLAYLLSEAEPVYRAQVASRQKV